MDVGFCNSGDEAASSQQVPSSSLLKGLAPVFPLSPSSPTSPLCHTVSSSSPAASSSEDLLTSADQFLDSFLRDALNSRNRITVLRLDLEVEKFVKNPKKQQLLLNPMPSSYERLVAHRVAQHYHVQSMALDSGNPSAPWVLLVKTPDSRLPSMKLADVTFELSIQTKSTSPPPGKLAIKQRSNQASMGIKSMFMGRIKSVEERMEEYNKARARIFRDGDSRTIGDESLSLNEAMCSGGSERDTGGSDFVVKSANTVAVFRDREKDMKDPDYDRNRYSQSTKVASMSPSMILGPYSSTGLRSSSVIQVRYGELQGQGSFSSSCDNHGSWSNAGVIPVVGYPSVSHDGLGQSFCQRHSNVYHCHEDFVYPRHYSSVDWRQDPSKSNSCSILAPQHVGWSQNY